MPPLVCGLPLMANSLGVEHADAEPEIAQAEREIDRDGGFADPALAGRDRDDGLNTRHPDSAVGALCGRRSSGRGCAGARPPGRAFRRQRHHDGGCARQRLDGRLGAPAHRLPRIHYSSVHRDGEENLAVGHHDVGQDAGLGQGKPVRTRNAFEARQNLALRQCHMALLDRH